MIAWLFKGKVASQGEIREWKGGRFKKMGQKWVLVSAKRPLTQRVEGIGEAAQNRYDYAIASEMGGIIETALRDIGVSGYDSLVSKLKAGNVSTAHEIYKYVVDAVRSVPGTPGGKQSALDHLGRSLLALRDFFVTKPKAKLTVKKKTRTGKERYDYPEGKHSNELPVIRPTTFQAGKKSMGGWSITGPLKSEHVSKMLGSKSATLLGGTIDSKKPWIMPTKAEHMDLKYKGDSLTIEVRQETRRKKAKKGFTTARVQIKIPYSFAKAFLMKHIKSVRTKNNFIFRLERSAGYRDFLSKEESK